MKKNKDKILIKIHPKTHRLKKFLGGACPQTMRSISLRDMQIPKVQLGPRYEGQLNPMAEPIPHEVRPLVRTHVYHPYHAADRQAETDS